MTNHYETRQTSARQGFTLVEMLVVILVLSVLLAIALPLYLNAVSDAGKKSCRANMQTISNAAEAARVRMGSADFTAILATNRYGIDVDPADESIGALTDLQAIPVCPNNGVYSLRRGNTRNSTTFRVRCRGANHGTFQPGVDSL